MNNLTFPIILFLFSINVECKSVFKITVDQTVIVKQNTEYASASIWVSKASRYTKVVNAKFDIRKNIPNNLKVTVKLFEFLNNEYRPFAINLERPLCNFLELEYKQLFYPDFVKSGSHMPRPGCPLVKGNYSIVNYTADDANYPPTLPFKKSRMDVGFWYQNKEQFLLQVFVTFDRDVIIREKFA